MKAVLPTLPLLLFIFPDDGDIANGGTYNKVSGTTETVLNFINQIIFCQVDKFLESFSR